MEHKLQIALSLLGNPVAPKDITQLLGVFPETSLLRGERRPELDLPRQNIWSVRSDGRLKTIDSQWEQLKRLFEQKWDVFVGISRRGTTKITIIVDATDRIPSIVIPFIMSKDAFSLNAEIDIDCYQ